MKPTIEPLEIGIAALKTAYKQMNRWQKTFDEMFNGHFVPQYNNELETALITVLEKVYNDTETLSWWVYEMEFGTKAKNGSMTDEKGNNIPMRTVRDLYRYYEKYTLNQKTQKSANPFPQYRSIEKVCQILENEMSKKGKWNGKT